MTLLNDLDLTWPRDDGVPERFAALDASEWMLRPTCGGCFSPMDPVGRGGWWCDPCQEFQ